jgi:hypothetical protein
MCMQNSTRNTLATVNDYDEDIVYKEETDKTDPCKYLQGSRICIQKAWCLFISYPFSVGYIKQPVNIIAVCKIKGRFYRGCLRQFQDCLQVTFIVVV